MKKLVMLSLMIFMPLISNGSKDLLFNNIQIDSNNVPSYLMSSSETTVVEWGCPISEVVIANNSAEALRSIGEACMNDVRQAAIEKPGIFEVINISVIWPDIQVSEAQDGYYLEGTLFLETLLMKTASGGNPYGR